GLEVRYRDWYRARVRAAEADWSGPSQHERLDQVEIELDNIREAFHVSLTQPEDDEAALEIAAGLVDFWIVRGHHLSEGRRWLENALASRPRGSAARAVALVNAGRLAYAQGDSVASIRLLNEGVQLSREIGDTALIAFATLNLLRGLHYGGELQSALAISTRAVDLCRQSGNEVLRHWALYIQADLLSANGEYAAPVAL